MLSDAITGGIDRLTPDVTDSLGLFTVSVLGTNHEVYQRGVSLASATRSGNITDITVPITVFARNLDGSIGDFSNRECSFFAVHEGLTDAEVLDLAEAVQALQTALHREV